MPSEQICTVHLVDSKTFCMHPQYLEDHKLRYYWEVYIDMAYKNKFNDLAYGWKIQKNKK